ncbi:MAG: NAD-dependent epimerase/dehydratase family protein [Deltaproteobacteria bacterium]|nr:NAD-dependent epimerase/dehydratase family protein [Deltaproteobacteria bacterium]
MYKCKHFLVTGGAGFVGSHITAKLVSQGHKVIVIDNLSNGCEDNIPGQAEFIKADLSQEKDFCKLRNLSCDAVFHLAAQSSGALSFKDPLTDLQSHVMATYFLLEWSRKNGVKRFLYSSSTTTYGEPLYLPVDENHPQQPKTFYSAGKIACEAYIKLFQTMGIETTIFRLPNVYGPCQNLENKEQGMVSIYLSYILEGRPIIVKGPLKRFRDFIYVDDVVGAFLMAVDNPVSYGKIYNLASGKKTTVQEILDGLITACGYTDYPIEVRDGTPGDQFGIVCDITLVKKDLGWAQRTSIQDGLAKTVRFEKRKLIDE